MNSNNSSSSSGKRGRGSSFWRGRGNWRGRCRGGWRGKSQNRTSSLNGKSSEQAFDGEQTSTPETYSFSRELTKQISIDKMFTPIPGCYKAWKLYHPMEEYNTASPTVNKIKAVEKFIEKIRDSYNISDIEKKKAFNVDVKVLMKDEEFLSDWPNFAEHLSNQPDHSLNCLSLAMHQFVLSALEKELSEDEVATEISLPMIKVRLVNYEPIVQIKHLAANTFGKLVRIEGTVIRVGQPKLLCTWLAFGCNKCGCVQCVLQTDGAHTPPTACPAATHCPSRSFTPLHSSVYTQTVNWQTIKLQEILADDQRDRGRVPRTVECELIEELVHCCSPGDVVSITGIVKIRSSDENSHRKNKSASVYDIYIDGRSVSNTKNYSSGSKQNNDVEFTTNDYYAIQELQANEHLFRLVVNSLCPSIYGHEMVKAGLILALVGGAQGQRAQGQGKGASRRADSHVLVVGDPGLGKSQMLQACSLVAPRAVYVCGNTSTASGLTVTLTREGGGGGQFALEAGALVLADQGVCCIDEFDKMAAQHQALLEAMEQQVISVMKAGVICSLPARTSILAAANPVGGHYNKAKTVAENLRLGSALLSRFDLVFILQDRPDEYLDTLLSEHVMALYSNFKTSASSSASASVCGDDSSVVSGITCSEPHVFDPNIPLSKRLKLRPGEVINVIAPGMLRKYIAYARKYITAVQLTAEAVAVLQSFYLQLREQHHSFDATPITTRQLESLVRLTQARAKLELREEASALDAIEVVELMRWSLVDTFSTDLHTLDFQRSQHGSGMSSRNQAKRFISVLQRQADQNGSSLFSVDEMKEIAARNNIAVNDFYTFLSSLNNHGFLIKKGKNQYQLLSVDY